MITSRIDVIGSNGNNGEHYQILELWDIWQSSILKYDTYENNVKRFANKLLEKGLSSG